MIIVSMDRKNIGYFKDYNDLFENPIGVENTKFIAVDQNAIDRNWAFTIHPPQRVAAFFAHLKDSCEAIKEAFEEGLPLIEICTGDFTKPQYIAQTPNTDMDYLKKKWCLDYCNFNHFLVKKY
jgi:hypothetical protein